MRPRRGEAGYALVAAVASIAVFATIALMVISATRGTVISASAEIGRARAQAAAEAGLALALRDLLNAGPAGAPPIDGQVRHVRFDGADLAIAIEDERGKVPVNALEEDQARRLFEAVGLSGERLDIATDSFMDWADDDDEPRPNGAEAPHYASHGIRPRNGLLRSVGEMAQIRGLDAELVRRLESIATVHFGRGSFEPGHATPAAIRVIEGETRGAVDIISRQREMAGQRAALALGTNDSLVGRPLTIRVEARTADGARVQIRQIAILTGRAAAPYVLKDRY